jgi:HK97 family phage prohead protease
MSDVTVKSSSGGFEGYASTFYTLDKAGDVVMPGCYKDGLKEFLDDGFISGSMHNWTEPLGKYTEAYEDRKGLYVKGQFSDVDASKQMRTLMRDGVIKKLSVGMEPLQTSMVSPYELEQIWEKAGYKPDKDDLRRLKSAKTIRLIEKAKLLEVSPVTGVGQAPHGMRDSVQSPQSFRRTIDHAPTSKRGETVLMSSNQNH